MPFSLLRIRNANPCFLWHFVHWKVRLCIILKSQCCSWGALLDQLFGRQRSAHWSQITKTFAFKGIDVHELHVTFYIRYGIGNLKSVFLKTHGHLHNRINADTMVLETPVASLWHGNKIERSRYSLSHTRYVNTSKSQRNTPTTVKPLSSWPWRNIIRCFVNCIWNDWRAKILDSDSNHKSYSWSNKYSRPH